VMAPAQMIEPKDLPPEVGARLQDSVVDSAHAGARLDLHGVAESVAFVAPPASPLTMAIPTRAGSQAGWESDLEAEAIALLGAGKTDVWDTLTHRFESRLILAALANTKGRRIEAAQKLGIGRNTITRKIQELGLE